jgi:hypothetical protein
MTTIPELLGDHVSLVVECADRVYLNGYVPTLQSSGALVYFLQQHRGEAIASPATLGQIGRGFVTGVETFAQEQAIPLVHFQKGQRKDDVVALSAEVSGRRRGGCDWGGPRAGVQLQGPQGDVRHKRR